MKMDSFILFFCVFYFSTPILVEVIVVGWEVVIVVVGWEVVVVRWS